jgi:histidine triad (HIT) family protein
MTAKTLFEKIIDREIPADIVHEDAHSIAFRDINPQAPLHVLVCPKKPLPMLSTAAEEDAELLGHLLITAAAIAKREGYGDAFRLAINNGAAVGQTVFHVHVHVLGGRRFTWPPG